MLKVGTINLEAPFFQAALSGYSDYAMRKLALSFGAPLTFAPLMLAKSVAVPKVLAKTFFRPHDDEHPVGAQILGNDPHKMAEAAKALEGVGYDLIDLNFACPAGKVLRRRRGGYLLKDPTTLIDIYRRVRDSVSCPVLVKLRAGFDHSGQMRDNFQRIVADLAARSADAVIIHPRTVVQKFSGSADWRLLAEMKCRFPRMTIIGSGDLFDVNAVRRLLTSCRVDGVAIARGAIGNPWIFMRLRSFFECRSIPEHPTVYEQGKVILRHFKWVAQLYKQSKAVRYFRKFIVGYCKLHPQRKKVQRDLLAAADSSQLLAALDKWYTLS